MTVLAVESLGKCFRLYPSPRARLKELLTGQTAHQPYCALRDVTFRLERGECLGVVGDNGAGKSTLLKLIAGTLRPSTGTVTRWGRLTAILELGAGFHPEFTGRENVFFAGSLMGISHAELKRHFDEILSFSELEENIDRPIKTYSSGMVMRLAFSLVTSVAPEILIVDEALAVGDQHFQKKCIDRMMHFRHNGCTIVFCSHSLYHVKQLCSQAIWLQAGVVAAQGATATVVAAYENHVRRENAELPAPEETSLQWPTRPPIGATGESGRLLDVVLTGVTEDNPPVLASPDLTITVSAWLRRGEPPPHLGVLIERTDGVWVYGVATHLEARAPTQLDEQRWQACVRFPRVPLLSGEYGVSAYLLDSTGLVTYEEWLKCRRFDVVTGSHKVGMVELPHEWL